jgi:hypothetical protein
LNRHGLPLLSVELIPKPVFGENLRNRLTRSEWEKCKKFARAASGDVCGICGGVGVKGRLDCHERWDWLKDGELHVQKLVGLIALCPRCHSAKHYGRTQIMGYASDAEEQLKKVNGWAKQLNDHLLAARDQWLERNAHDWKLDLDWLPATLGIIPGPARETEFSAQPPTAEAPAVAVPAHAFSTVGQLKQAQATLTDLQEQLKQARYRAKCAESWKEKITDPEAGEQRLAEAVAEAKDAANAVRRQKAAVKRLAENLDREQKRERTLKRAQKTWPQYTRDEIDLADNAARTIGTTRAVILRDYVPVTRQQMAAERGMTVEAWVESSFALERFQDAMALREAREVGPDVPLDEKTAADLDIVLATPDPISPSGGH